MFSSSFLFVLAFFSVCSENVALRASKSSSSSFQGMHFAVFKPQKKGSLTLLSAPKTKALPSAVAGTQQMATFQLPESLLRGRSPKSSSVINVIAQANDGLFNVKEKREHDSINSQVSDTLLVLLLYLIHLHVECKT